MAVRVGTAYVDVRPNMTGFSQQVSSGARGVFGKVAGLAKGAVAPIAGIFAAKEVVQFGAEAVRAAEDAQRSTRAFNAALERTGQLGAINEEKFNSWLQTMGESIGQDDEDLRDLATSLVSAFDFRKLGGDATEWAMLTSRGIQDVAAATQKSSGLIKRMFLTLLNDPAAAVTQLKKLGVITEEQAEHYSEMAEAGKEAEVTQELLTKITDKYAGAAEANTTATDKLHTVWENMKETLGNFLLPLFEKFVEGLTAVVSWFRDAASGAGTLGDKLGFVGQIFQGLWQAGQTLFNFFKDDLLEVWRAIVDVVMEDLWPAIQNLIEAFKSLWPVLKIVLGITIGIQVVLLKVALKVLPVLLRVLGFLIKVLSGVIKVAAELVHDVIAGFVLLGKTVGTIFGAIKDAIVGAWKLIKGAWDGARSFFRKIWDGIKGAALGVWRAIGDAARTALNFVIGAINTIIDGMNFAIELMDKAAGPFVNFGEIPHIPKLASGGVVTKPTIAMIGESGPEAVVPLRGRGEPVSMRILDWRNGIGQLDGELGWEDRQP